MICWVTSLNVMSNSVFGATVKSCVGNATAQLLPHSEILKRGPPPASPLANAIVISKVPSPFENMASSSQLFAVPRKHQSVSAPTSVTVISDVPSLKTMSKVVSSDGTTILPLAGKLTTQPSERATLNSSWPAAKN